MEQKIKQIIEELDIGTLKAFSWLGNGFSSHSYQVDTTEGSYVLLESKENAVEETNYKTYFANLRCLEKKKYPHAPKPVYVSPDGRSLLITKVDGVEVTKLKDVSAADRKTIAFNIANALIALQSVKPSDLEKEFEALGLQMPEPFSGEKDWDTYVIKTFYPYKDSCPDDAQAAWLEAQITAHTPVQSVGTDVCFRHGDTSGPNVLIGKYFSVMLIDWGGSKFYLTSESKEDFGLAYTMNHIDIMHEFKEEILHYAAEKQKISYDDLEKHVFEKQKDIKIADIAWAFMMYTRATAGEVQDKPETFKEILDTRIEEYKSVFLNPS